MKFRLAILIALTVLLPGCVGDYVSRYGIPPWIQKPTKPVIENLF